MHRWTRTVIAPAAVGIALTACGIDAPDNATGELQPPPVAIAASGSVVASQGAAVSQNLAHARITVVYNRPVARGREIFGALVPFGDVWHPGADRATYLRTSADILVGGERLPAGSYSLWTIPGPDEWTVTLHSDWDVFHMPFPGEDGVALRIRVRPGPAEHMETLAFYFPVADRRAGVLALHWADTRIEIPIEAPFEAAGGAEPGDATPRGDP